MAIQRKKVDGGILILKRYTGGGLVPFKLQALEVDELDLTSVAPRHQGNKVAGGIEYDPYNKPGGILGSDNIALTGGYGQWSLHTSKPKDVIFFLH